MQGSEFTTESLWFRVYLSAHTDPKPETLNVELHTVKCTP